MTFFKIVLFSFISSYLIYKCEQNNNVMFNEFFMTILQFLF